MFADILQSLPPACYDLSEISHPKPTYRASNHPAHPKPRPSTHRSTNHLAQPFLDQADVIVESLPEYDTDCVHEDVAWDIRIVAMPFKMKGWDL